MIKRYKSRIRIRISNDKGFCKILKTISPLCVSRYLGQICSENYFPGIISKYISYMYRYTDSFVAVYIVQNTTKMENSSL